VSTRLQRQAGGFLATFEREGMKRGEALRRVLSAAKSGRDGIRGALMFYAGFSCGMEGKRGCLVCRQCRRTVHPRPGGRAAGDRVASPKSKHCSYKLIRQGQADGSIRAAIDCEATARLMLCVLQGMRVVGKTGRTHAQMSAVAIPR